MCFNMCLVIQLSKSVKLNHQLGVYSSIYIYISELLRYDDLLLVWHGLRVNLLLI